MAIDTIEQGLFQFDLVDYHAILGVSLEADSREVRKRYLKIARKLHPDSLREATAEEKQQASELLSKMVNPAYEKLSQEKEAAEYKVLLRLRGQQLGQQASQGGTPVVSSGPAQELLTTGNLEAQYISALKSLTEQQYDSLESVFTTIGHISELNLIYLMRTAGGNTGAVAPPPPAPAPGGDGSAPVPAPPPPPRPPTRASILDNYLSRAKELEAMRDYSRAILEMREAIQNYPSHADSHSYLASLYLQAGQATMARIHVKRSLELDPENALGKSLEPKVGTGKGGRKADAKNPPKGKGGGLFGLFGGRGK